MLLAVLPQDDKHRIHGKEGQKQRSFWHDGGAKEYLGFLKEPHCTIILSKGKSGMENTSNSDNLVMHEEFTPLKEAFGGCQFFWNLVGSIGIMPLCMSVRSRTAGHFGVSKKSFQCLFLQLYKLHRIACLSHAKSFLSQHTGFFPEYISLLPGERSIDSCSANVSPPPLCVTLLYIFRSLSSL